MISIGSVVCVCAHAWCLVSAGIGRSTKGYWFAARFGLLQVYGIKVSCDKFQDSLISGVFKAAGTVTVIVFATVIWFSEVFVG